MFLRYPNTLHSCCPGEITCPHFRDSLTPLPSNKIDLVKLNLPSFISKSLKLLSTIKLNIAVLQLKWRTNLNKVLSHNVDLNTAPILQVDPCYGWTLRVASSKNKNGLEQGFIYDEYSGNTYILWIFSIFLKWGSLCWLEVKCCMIPFAEPKGDMY